MFCNHHYQYTQGYFYCKKCGHKRYGTHKKRRDQKRIGFAIGIPVIFLIGFIVFVQYPQFLNVALESDSTDLIQEKITQITNEIPKTVEKIPIPTQHEIERQIQETKNTVTESIDTITTISSLNTDSTALKIHDLINEQRTSHGLRPLGWHPTISQAAISHSDDMATRNYFAHDSPEGLDFTKRYARVGFNCEIPISSTMYSGGAENIFMLEGYYGEDTVANQAVNGWMNSEGHRENILTPYFLNEGIGVVVSDNGAVYITQNFC